MVYRIIRKVNFTALYFKDSTLIMKIVYVSREFGFITGGGIGTYIANVTKYMANRGHEVYLVTDCFNESNIQYLPRNIHLVPTESIPNNHQGCNFTWLLEYSQRVYQTLKNLLQKQKIDVIEFSEYGAEGFFSIKAKKLLNDFNETKLVVKTHTPTSLLLDINEVVNINYKTEITVYTEDYCVRHADMVVSPSISLADYYKQRLQLQLIHQSPYPLLFESHKKREKQGIANSNRIVFVGTVQVRKGVDFFIEAAKIVLEKAPHFLFEIYGKDSESSIFGQSYTEYLKNRVPEHLKSNIVFKGAIPYEQINDVFLNSCFCVFPSRWENWPNVCLEAMSLGCVVIGSKNGGMSEMIEHRVSGFLVDPYDPKEIACTILDNYRNDSILQSISDKARTSIQQWCNPDLVCQKIESQYQLQAPSRQWLGGDNPKISVIIPLYNQGQYVEEAIISIKESTYHNIEIIVVNDGSTDVKTNQIFDQLEGVIKINKPNGGLSSARNAGIKASTGDFIFPLDADDKIHKNFISDAVRCLQNNQDIDYVGCWSQYFGLSNQVWIPIGFIDDVSFLFNTINSCSALFRRSVFDIAGFYDEEMISYEDWDLFLRLAKYGIKGDVLPMYYLFYRVKEPSQSMLQGTGIPRAKIIQQYILRKYQDYIGKSRLLRITQMLIDLWKEEQNIKSLDNRWLSMQMEMKESQLKAMESSKFWKLRKIWFKLKGILELAK